MTVCHPSHMSVRKLAPISSTDQMFISYEGHWQRARITIEELQKQFAISEHCCTDDSTINRLSPSNMNNTIRVQTTEKMEPCVFISLSVLSEERYLTFGAN